MKFKHTFDFPLLRWLREPRLLIIAGGVTLMVVVTALALVQTPTVAAPPPPLRGPFHFIELPDEVSTTETASTLTWIPFYTQTFTFGGDFSGWKTVTSTEHYTRTAPHKWGRVQYNYYPGQNFTNTLWAVADPYPELSVDWTVHADSAYTKAMDTYAIYGPLNTQQFAQFRVDFDYWIDVEPGARFGWAFSCDGTNFYGKTETSSHARQWQPMGFGLAYCPASSTPPAYLAFYFQSSDTQTPDGLGAFVDNLVISGAPWKQIYLPIIRRDITPTPTASPTPAIASRELVKSYYYEAEEEYRWCENDNTSMRWTAVRDYVGGGSRAYRMWTNRPDKFMLSPQYNPPNDYSIETKFSFMDMNGFDLASYRTAKFGLVFGVDGVVFSPWDSTHCDTDPSGGGYYEFKVRVNEAGNGYEYQLRRLRGGQPEWVYADWVAVPAGTSISSTGWNTLRLDRKGSGIVAYINGNLIVSTTEGTWTGARWWGFTMDCPGCDEGRAFRVNWDDTQIYRIP